MRRLLVPCLVSLAACGAPPSATPPACESTLDWGRGGEAMFPGTDCLHCHTSGGRATSAFSVGGTVFGAKTCPTPVATATVHVTDATGVALSLPVNDVGNFHSDAPLSPPLHIAVEVDGRRVEMKSTAGTGACGSCHASGSAVGFVTAP